MKHLAFLVLFIGLVSSQMASAGYGLYTFTLKKAVKEEGEKCPEPLIFEDSSPSCPAFGRCFIVSGRSYTVGTRSTEWKSLDTVKQGRQHPAEFEIIYHGLESCKIPMLRIGCDVSVIHVERMTESRDDLFRYERQFDFKSKAIVDKVRLNCIYNFPDYR